MKNYLFQLRKLTFINTKLLLIVTDVVAASEWATHSFANSIKQVNEQIHLIFSNVSLNCIGS